MTNRVVVRTSVDPKAANDLDKLRGKFTALQNQGAKGLMIGAGVAATNMAFNAIGRAVGGVADFLGDSVDAASDLNESLGKSSVVFGKNAAAIESWAERGAEAFGLSKQAALEAAGTYGNLFQAFGLGQDEATKMSKTLVELAADLASFNNTSMEDAILALRSGLSGETEPLKRYGIAISDARMRTELMSQGITDLAGTLTPLQKTTAAYALIMKDSALAQGDFARTSEGLANSQRTTAAEIENLKAKVGAGLIPVEQAWLKVQLAIVDSTGQLIDEMDAIGEAQRRLGFTASKDEVEELARQLGTTTFEFGKVRVSGDKATDTIEDLGAAADSLTAELRPAATSAGTLRGTLRDLGYEADQADDAIDGLASTISEELFGDAINAGNLAQLKDTHRELIKQRDAAKEGSREYQILTGEIAANEQAMFGLQLQMAEKDGPTAVIDFLNKARDKYGQNNTKLQAMIDNLREMWGLLNRFSDIGAITFGRYDGKLIPGFHAGGRPTPGEPAIVGEKGPELFVPDTAGTIVPNRRMGGGSSYGGGSGSPVVIQLELDGAVLARVTDRRLRYASPRSASLPD